MQCSAWGDPHFTNFDKKRFDFMGACKYEFVSTDCLGKNLPANLVPFNIRIKNTKGKRRKGVSLIEYVEINAFGNQYKLTRFTNKKTQKVPPFEINGVAGLQPLSDLNNGVNIYSSLKKIIFSTNFGLTVVWDGKHKLDVRLCDSYANATCGLCGNADGIKTNDFVDRLNVNVPIKGKKKVKYFVWGTEWKIPSTDGSLDQDGSS